MTNRVLLSPSRIAVSRPGVDVLSPPAYSSDFMALDSNFSGNIRPLLKGFMFNKSIKVGWSVSYGVTYAAVPFPEVYILNSGSPRSLTLYQMRGGDGLYYNGISMFCLATGFSIGQQGGTPGDDSFLNGNRDWFYIVWPGA